MFDIMNDGLISVFLFVCLSICLILSLIISCLKYDFMIMMYHHTIPVGPDGDLTMIPVDPIAEAQLPPFILQNIYSNNGGQVNVRREVDVNSAIVRVVEIGTVMEAFEKSFTKEVSV